MKELFTFPTQELQKEDTVYVTLAMELHATTLTNDKDRIQFENLLSEARKNLKESDLDEKDQLLAQLDVVERHLDELIQFIGGLTVYVTTEDIYYYHLAIPVKERVQIGKLPYVLPLVSNYQYSRNYHLLILNRESIRLFEGQSGNIEEIILDDIEDAPVDLEAALGTEKEGGDLSFGTYSNSRSNRGTGQFFHGHTETSGEKEIDRERYFNLVDKFIYEQFSSKKKIPLIIYSVEENQAVFRSVSNNEYLAKSAVTGSAADMNTSEIQQKVSKTIDEIIAYERNELLERLVETSPENRIENIPDDLTVASIQGQIESLYVEKWFEIPGSITDEGRYDASDEKNDFIQRIIQNVIRTNGEVYILEEDEIPNGTQIAAKLRY